jgi:pimeloyl-ACP methyl ester carboxylesterase
MSLKTVKLIPGARLVLFPDLGHAPHVQNPQRFQNALLNGLVALDND